METRSSSSSPVASAEPLSIPPKWQAGALAAILVTLAALHLTNPSLGALYGKFECVNYVHSVNHPLQWPIDTHYGYRLLPPLIVRFLPCSHELGFLIVDYLSLAGAAWILFRILAFEGIRYELGILSAVLFLSFPGSTQWQTTYSACPDAFYLLLIAAAFHCIQLRRWLGFSLMLFLGAFTKETIWILWPVALLYGQGPLRRGYLRRLHWLRRIENLFPSVAAFYIVRVFWPSANTGYSWLEDIRYNLTVRFLQKTDAFLVPLPKGVEFLTAFVVVYGMVLLLLLFHPRECLAAVKREPWVILFILGMSGTSFVGGFSNTRYQIYVAVPMLYLFCRVAQAHWNTFGHWPVAIPLLAMQSYFSEFAGGRDSDSLEKPVLWVLLWVVAALVVAGLKRFGQRALTPPAPAEAVCDGPPRTPPARIGWGDYAWIAIMAVSLGGAAWFELASAKADYERGRKCYYEGRDDLAILYFSKAIRKHPAFPAAYNSRGNAYYKKGEAALAVADYTKALEFQPGDPQLYENRAVVYQATGRFQLAIDDCTKAIGLAPSEGHAYYGRAVGWYGLKDYERSWKDLDTARKLGAKINPKFEEVLVQAAPRQSDRK